MSGLASSPTQFPIFLEKSRIFKSFRQGVFDDFHPILGTITCESMAGDGARARLVLQKCFHPLNHIRRLHKLLYQAFEFITANCCRLEPLFAGINQNVRIAHHF